MKFESWLNLVVPSGVPVCYQNNPSIGHNTVFDIGRYMQEFVEVHTMSTNFVPHFSKHFDIEKVYTTKPTERLRQLFPKISYQESLLCYVLSIVGETKDSKCAKSYQLLSFIKANEDRLQRLSFHSKYFVEYEHKKVMRDHVLSVISKALKEFSLFEINFVIAHAVLEIVEDLDAQEIKVETMLELHATTLNIHLKVVGYSCTLCQLFTKTGYFKLYIHATPQPQSTTRPRLSELQTA